MRQYIFLFLLLPLIIFTVIGGCDNSSSGDPDSAFVTIIANDFEICEYSEEEQAIWDATVECLVLQGFITQEEADILETPCVNLFDVCEDICCNVQFHYKRLIRFLIFDDADIFNDDIEYWLACTVEDIEGLCLLELEPTAPNPVISTVTLPPGGGDVPPPPPPGDDDDDKPKCNSGLGNGEEGCNPGSSPDNDNDEPGGNECGTPGNPCANN